MNYYNPYFLTPVPVSRGFGSFFRNINWNSILNNTQRTLNIVNQTIPMIKQVRPLISNARTMFRVMNEFKKMDNPQSEASSIEKENKKVFDDQGPTFFM